MRKIEIYGRQGCTPCANAKKFCAEHGFNFVYRDVIEDPQARAEMLARNPKATTVPQIFIGDTLVGGYAELSGRPLNELQQMIGE
ncbi:MAG: glutaredoxin [Mesorhizobium sp.]|nr:MAG: glutaredoxin [Mesorhizobium sp.]